MPVPGKTVVTVVELIPVDTVEALTVDAVPDDTVDVPVPAPELVVC